MRDEFRLLACAEARASVSLVEPAPQFRDKFHRTSRERADFRAGLTVADRARPIGNVNGDRVRGILALRAVARLTIHRRAGTVEDHLEAQIGVHDAALRSREAGEDAFTLAP